MTRPIHFVPFRDKHSIEHVVLGIDFEEPLSSGSINDIQMRSGSMEKLPFCLS
jgi:hypothetical protein